MTHLAILPFNALSTRELLDITLCVVPEGKLRPRGKSDQRYFSYLAGRCAIFKVFSEINAKSHVLPNKKYGFLEVISPPGKGPPPLFVNVSHTENVSVAVVSTHPIGVDIESRARSAQKVLPRVATEREKKWVLGEGSIESIPRDIFLWSSKEAASKAFGLGMKFGLKGFEIIPSDNLKIYDVKSEIVGPLKLKNPALSFEVWEDYFITMCSEKSSLLGGVQRWLITPSEFKRLWQKADSRKNELTE